MHVLSNTRPISVFVCYRCSWSKAANMLYVDAPAGVGMSYSETPRDYHTNDTQTAKDMNAFLRRWFTKFSEFEGNEFYVAGEKGGCQISKV